MTREPQQPRPIVPVSPVSEGRADDACPDVSVVIAAYNTAGSVERAVAAALDQTGVTVEVIVADDCSTDGTRDVVRGIADPRVLLVALEVNRGPAGARNAAFRIARGRWIAVLDSDDTMAPDRLSRLLARAARDGADIVVDNLDVLDMAGQRRTMFAPRTLAGLPRLDLATFIGSNVLFRSEHNYGYMKPVFRRGFLEAKGLAFDEGLRVGEDYLLLASALAEGAVCAVEPVSGYTYHIRAGSISRVLRLDHVETMQAADRRFLDRYPLSGAALAAQRQRMRSMHEAHAFILLVEAIKARAPGRVLAIALKTPGALRHLKMPIKKRLKRLLGLGSPRSGPSGPAARPTGGSDAP